MKKFALNLIILAFTIPNICLGMEDNNRPTPLYPINESEERINKEIEEFEGIFDSFIEALLTQLKTEVSNVPEENILKFCIGMRLQQEFEMFVQQSGLSDEAKIKIRENSHTALPEIINKLAENLMRSFERPESTTKRSRHND